jgi:DNA-dependent RNA polymerase auxiliary subunit epsilon
VEHLINVLKLNYEIDTDWDGTRYIGLTLEWDYINRRVHLSMPGYIAKALIRFAHPPPNKPQHQPHPHTERTYGATIQYAKKTDESPPLEATDKTYIQQVLGVLLYYGRAVDSTVLVALSSIASMQATPTALTMELIKIILDYIATHPDAILTYEKSDMVLAVHSDASYLSEAGARSRAGGHFFMSTDTEDPPNNGAIINTSTIIKSVMSSAAEAELAGLYINASQAVAIRQLLHEMGHNQPRTPIQTDNSTALGVVTNNIQPRRTKSMDMRFYWLRCRDAQGQFRYYWRPGPTNLADYWTKHHPASHHIEKRPSILTSKLIIDALRASTNRTPATRGKGLIATAA